MTTEWSLDELYKGFDDPAYGKDVAELTAQIDALATLLADAGRMQEKERTETVSYTHLDVYKRQPSD